MLSFKPPGPPPQPGTLYSSRVPNMLDCCRQTQASERNAVTVLEAIPQRAATANPFTSGNPGSIGAAVVAAVVAMAVPEDPVVAVPTCADAIIPANAAKASIGDE